MNNTDVIVPDTFYHIYNRAVGSEKMFIEDLDYRIFMYKWQKFISPVAELYSYVLIPNHFHMLVRVRPDKEVEDVLQPTASKSLESLISKRFSNFYNSYAKTINYKYSRMGKLFMLPFKRKCVDNNIYLTQLVFYIHQNPIHHGLCSDVGAYTYSSYKEMLLDTPSIVHRNAVLDWFGGKEAFLAYHAFLNRVYGEG